MNIENLNFLNSPIATDWDIPEQLKCCFANVFQFIDVLFGKGATRVMIIDLDAHQGNGHARDFMSDGNSLFLSLQGSGLSHSIWYISFKTDMFNSAVRVFLLLFRRRSLSI